MMFDVFFCFYSSLFRNHNEWYAECLFLYAVWGPKHVCEQRAFPSAASAISGTEDLRLRTEEGPETVSSEQ